MPRPLSLQLVCAALVAIALASLTVNVASANRGFVPIDSGPPAPPSKTCGNSCCPSNRICVCDGCFDPYGPLPRCAFPGPGIVYSCCDNVGAQCNRCNGDCCLGDDVCSCKGTCIAQGDPGPVCGPEDFGDFGYPLRNCCETPETGGRCSGLQLPVLIGPVKDTGDPEPRASGAGLAGPQE